MSERPAVTRTPVTIVSRDPSAFRDTYGGAVGLVATGATLIRPETPSDTVLVTMHPIGGTGGLPVMRLFAEAGVHVLAADSRYRGVDNALIMEKVALDLGAAVRHAREKLGYANVILLGWSGGGALSAFYQAEAEQPSITHTPAGDPLSLAEARMIPADGVILMAAHVSRHCTLTEWLDASILDEQDPDRRDPALDLYGEAVRPPYDAVFLDRYRAAQEARNRRITAWVKDRLETLRRRGRPNDEFGFVVHGTMADPRWLDPAVDPNDRAPGVCYLGDPRVVNMSPIGLARFSTLRSWLSQWSLDDARADGPRCLSRVKSPVLVINNSADDACTPSHARRLYEAVAHGDRRFHEIAGATHYYQDQPELGAQAVGLVKTWLEDHGFRI
ncbi:MAG: alpha/beta hydrolase [Phenylobacterium sp.]|uniref:alpha/beta hydrolase n=2 Tax=Phenylobacterium sp. TaxID=1871053 RepID=UPI0025DB0C5E|nr:alpha/beta hydrolase [Phenylobacterium sp.]MCA6223903.1 alpha/beta hydrolase [Phenylobacterium sp.]MCA6231623.1 alpha/beta hydrolase [Phenylobacterium sp.]MCA6234407.1 alpha/beta hydrolase [Phenylobacterium sp.]MCA6253059.1 alpha/beta hydrolase [Phenylobacterium sp.]MCA6264847.1 alpha/beta hydrolase [Phenylobacterium sp.]